MVKRALCLGSAELQVQRCRGAGAEVMQRWWCRAGGAEVVQSRCRGGSVMVQRWFAEVVCRGADLEVLRCSLGAKVQKRCRAEAEVVQSRCTWVQRCCRTGADVLEMLERRWRRGAEVIKRWSRGV